MYVLVTFISHTALFAMYAISFFFEKFNHETKQS